MKGNVGKKGSVQHSLSNGIGNMATNKKSAYKLGYCRDDNGLPEGPGLG